MSWYRPADVGFAVRSKLADIGQGARLFAHLLRLLPATLRRPGLVSDQVHFLGNYSLGIITVSGLFVGFVMARADLGDFGRTDPTAVLDTIGVDGEYEHQGIGHALLSQLFLNLAALRIDRVETVVAPRDLALLGFLYDVGFEPSQRIAFVRTLK